MTTRSPRMRADFDPSRTFKTVHAMVISGVHLEAGIVFPKELVTQRRMRQLFESRRLTMLPMGEAVPVAPELDPILPDVPVLMDQPPPPVSEQFEAETPTPAEEPVAEEASASPVEKPQVEQPVRQRHRVRI
jgi:hypothetical protein